MIDSVAGEVEALKIKYGLPTVKTRSSWGRARRRPKVILAAADAHVG